MKKKSTEYPHNKKQAAAQVAKLKAAAAKKKKPVAKKKAAPKTGAAKNMTDAQLAAIGRDYMKKTKPKAKAKPKVKNLPGKKGAKKTYKPY